LENCYDNEAETEDKDKESDENIESIFILKNNVRKIITPYDAIETVEELENWVGVYMPNELDIILKLKDAIYATRKNKKKDIFNYIRTK
jgi:hypothetical protein